MSSRVINIDALAEVAQALKGLKRQIVFVGGAVVSLYADNPAAEEVRPTNDIDLTIDIVGLSQWYAIQEQLGSQGFHPDPFGHTIGSYTYKGIPVDILSIEDGPFGSTNRWYKIGFENLWEVSVKEERIHILSAPCFLATKFEAFNNRGRDYRTSHDIEDIVYVLDHRNLIVDEIAKEDQRIALFIQEQLGQIVKKNLLHEVLNAHIHPLMLSERTPILEQKINQILQKSHTNS